MFDLKKYSVDILLFTSIFIYLSAGCIGLSTAYFNLQPSVNQWAVATLCLSIFVLLWLGVELFIRMRSYYICGFAAICSIALIITTIIELISTTTANSGTQSSLYIFSTGLLTCGILMQFFSNKEMGDPLLVCPSGIDAQVPWKWKIFGSKRPNIGDCSV